MKMAVSDIQSRIIIHKTCDILLSIFRRHYSYIIDWAYFSKEGLSSDEYHPTQFWKIMTVRYRPLTGETPF